MQRRKRFLSVLCTLCVFARKLSGLDADREVTDRDLLIRRDLGRFFTRYFFSIDYRGIATFRHEPVTPFVIT